MKIRGGSPFRGLKQTKGKSGSKKAGKSSFASHLDGVGEVDSVDVPEGLDSVSHADPVESAFSEASMKWEQDEENLEEATKAVVMSELREHIGNHEQLSDEEVVEIGNAVSDSIQDDDAMRGRLVSLFKELSKSKK